jgi:hypothetical protein
MDEKKVVKVFDPYATAWRVNDEILSAIEHLSAAYRGLKKLEDARPTWARKMQGHMRKANDQLREILNGIS